MGVPATDTERRPWSDPDKHRLIGLWEKVGSVVLIAILMERPVGSVQTEASRLQLPRRAEDKEHQRRKWTPEEDDTLLDTVEECRATDGRIRIIEVSERTRRSIDAIVNHLAEMEGKRSLNLRENLSATEAEIMEFGLRQAARNMPDDDAAVPGGRIDTRLVEKMRKCMPCGKPFWSRSAGNRICPKCKNNDSSDWD